MGSAYSLASGPEKGLIQDGFEWGREKPPRLTCIREAVGLRDPWGQDTDSLDREVQGFLFMGSAFPSLPVEAGRREASEKLWGRCGPEPRAPRPFTSEACWGTV